jgi:hypothetical protein
LFATLHFLYFLALSFCLFSSLLPFLYIFLVNYFPYPSFTPSKFIEEAMICLCHPLPTAKRPDWREMSAFGRERELNVGFRLKTLYQTGQ